MPKEIERKFRLLPGDNKLWGLKSTFIEQGYLSFDGTEIRIRRRTPIAGYVTSHTTYPPVVTVKQGAGVTREEIEFPVDPEVCDALMALAEPYVIRKTRYNWDRWEIDLFQGLVSPDIAEIELVSEDEPIPFIPIVDRRREVTTDPAFLNRNIALRAGSQAMAQGGYHLRHIPKGILGEVSKIREEVEELEDATIQSNRILQLVELSDIVGAVKHFATTLGTTLEECVAMADATERSFKVGER